MTEPQHAYPPVVLLWLEPTGQGSAARTHMDGTRTRLATLGITPVEQIFAEVEDASRSAKIRRIFGMIRRARKAAKRYPGAVLIARWHPFLAFVLRTWRRRGGVVLLAQGNDEAAFEVYPWFRKLPFTPWMIRESVVHASRVLTVNVGVQAWVESVFQSAGVELPPIAVLPTGVSNVFHSHPRAETGYGDYAAFVGSLTPWQGIEVLIEAWKQPEWPAGLRLVIVGWGAKEELVKAAIGDRLTWLDRQPPQRVAEILAGAQLTVCSKLPTPSMAETTTPFKILESVAVGVPVVASDIPAQRRMLEEHPYGVLYDATSATQLASAVARLYEDRTLRERTSEEARAVAPTLTWEYNAGILRDAIVAALK